jgi:hypothetical protein
LKNRERRKTKNKQKRIRKNKQKKVKECKLDIENAKLEIKNGRLNKLVFVQVAVTLVVTEVVV